MSSAPSAAPRRLPLTWLGLVPFAVFVTLFLILPTAHIVIGAFQDRSGAFTLQNLRDLSTGTIPSSYWISVKISVASAALGCLIGFAMAAAVTFGAVPGWIKAPLMTFSGVASNFAGVPLAFAFLATFGPVGLVTAFLRTNFGIVISRDLGFNILSFWGLTVTYLFFQIPLMILIITPALEGLKREWREAAEVLGATALQYWRMIALPILFPSLLGTFALLFANAFGAVATAIALTGSGLNIVPIQLFAQIRGDVLGNPNLGYAIAFGMILVTAVANVVYIYFAVPRHERGRLSVWVRIWTWFSLKLTSSSSTKGSWVRSLLDRAGQLFGATVLVRSVPLDVAVRLMSVPFVVIGKLASNMYSGTCRSLKRLAAQTADLFQFPFASIAGWAALIFGLLYFFVPLAGLFEFSMKARRGVYSFDAYAKVIGDPEFQATFTYSVVMALVTIVIGVLIVVPTAFWVRLKMPWARPYVEFLTLLPLVIPAIVIVFGYIRLYNTSSWLPLTGTVFGTNLLLAVGYTVLALPYMYRAVDTGLRTIDVATLTEAAQSLGAGWVTILGRVILPNVVPAVLSGAFLTFAIVIGEFTLAALLDRPAFGPYLQRIGANKPYEPFALSVISFGITWACMGLIQLVSRFSKHAKAAR